MSKPIPFPQPLPRAKEALLPVAREWLSTQRQQLREAFLMSGDAQALLTGQSDAIDTLLTALYGVISAKTSRVALVAVGGYGRREFFPYSDIDLLFLYDEKGDVEAAKIAEFILYILWDLGLKVGQAHRSIDEAIQLAREDITIRTNLLDARFIAGKQSVYAQFRKRFDEELVAGTVVEFIEAKLSERDGRHRRFGDSRYMLEPNVKEGKGGLRDLHTLWWLARYAYPVKELHDLVDLKKLTEDEYQAFERARDFLWRVRIHLHYLSDHPEERLTFDRQNALAVAMGYGNPNVIQSISRFMRRYFAAVRMVGNITRLFCALLEEENKRTPHKALGWLWHAPWKLDGFRLDGERLNVKSAQTFIQHPILMLELFKTAQANGLDIHPRALQLIAHSLPAMSDAVRKDPRANAIFLDILLSPNDPEVSLRRMSDAGVLGHFIPDFGRIIGQTQFNMYHVYTVDEHTLVAIGILHDLDTGKLKHEAPLASEVMHQIKMRRVLYLALFCHDIAKGRRGDHSQLGEKIAAKLAARFGFSDNEIETTAWLVRQHLLFTHTAFRRDIEDPKTLQDFVAQVQTPERLKLLLALTVADMRATGPTIWNAWKASLLRELYRRAEQRMGTGQSSIRQHQGVQFKQELQKLLVGWNERDIEHYLEQGNPGFWSSVDIMHHAVIARMVKHKARMPMSLTIDTQHDYERRITEIILATEDQHGLFSKVAGAMSLAGANIIGAKINTLKNGVAVEIFQVQDGSGDVFDRPDRLAKMSVYIEQALSGELDLADAIARNAPISSNPSLNAVPMPGQVFIENNASNLHSVIELAGRDRSGFLYDVTRVIAELGLSIATAHISTYGTQAADVFYVKDIFGMKILHDDKIRQVQAALIKVMGS